MNLAHYPNPKPKPRPKISKDVFLTPPPACVSGTISVDEFRRLTKPGAKIKTKATRVKAKSPGKDSIEFTLVHVCEARSVTFVREFQFAPHRKFRADWAIPEKKILIEYEGLVFNSGTRGTGKSGHTTPTGFTANCEKYNLATVYGYRVLRYTALNYRDLPTDLVALL